MSSAPYPMRVLIVDDMPTNVRILTETLKHTYDICSAENGRQALERVELLRPDLILLDIMMPGITGYEVLKELKASPEHRNIPVIFISARDDEKDEAYGLELGAVDYIAKPFRPAVVRARVKTHMELKLHRDRLNTLVHDRTSQLIHSDRLATLGTLSAAVSHEVENPLHYIVGNTEMIMDDLSCGRIEPIQQSALNIIKGVRRISALIQRLKGFSKKRINTKKSTPLADIIDDAREMLRYQLIRSGVELDMSGVDKDIIVSCDPHQISQVFVNLTNNSTDAFSGEAGRIVISARKDGEVAHITFTDNGNGIPPDKLATIFEPFVTESQGERGTGLGLFITRHILSRHKGSIEVTRSDKSGTEFTIRMPLDISAS